MFIYVQRIHYTGSSSARRTLLRTALVRGWSLNHKRKMHVSIIVLLYTMIEVAPYACSMCPWCVHTIVWLTNKIKDVGTRICDYKFIPILQWTRLMTIIKLRSDPCSRLAKLARMHPLLLCALHARIDKQQACQHGVQTWPPRAGICNITILLRLIKLRIKYTINYSKHVIWLTRVELATATILA
jgi:hypothetical protein